MQVSQVSANFIASWAWVAQRSMVFPDSRRILQVYALIAFDDYLHFEVHCDTWLEVFLPKSRNENNWDINDQILPYLFFIVTKAFKDVGGVEFN